MPYIKTARRMLLMPLAAFAPRDAGELNYQLTELALSYLRVHGRRYQTINDIVGALEGAKAEFQRRVVAPYEDSKIQENGDVFPSA